MLPARVVLLRQCCLRARSRRTRPGIGIGRSHYTLTCTRRLSAAPLFAGSTCTCLHDGFSPRHSALRISSRHLQTTQTKVDPGHGQDDGGDDHAAAAAPVSIVEDTALLKQIPLEDVRNFCFIAHVDHGKSSLASRVLELTGNLGREAQLSALGAATLSADNDGTAGGDDEDDGPDKISESQTPTAAAAAAAAANPSTNPSGKEQIELLDTLSVEKERGITVKATAASMLYRHPTAVGPTGCLLLNMVDTPGHADFGSEVSRSLSSVDGAVLLFDAAQGVQAQTLSVHEKATNMGVRIIPALTKVDLPSARPVDVALAVSDLFDFDPDAVLRTSARSRIGVRDVLEAVCVEVPSPRELSDDDGETLRAKVVDSWFEPLRGVVCLVQVLSGTIEEGDRVSVVDPGGGSGSGSGSDGGEGEGTDPKPTYGKDHYSVQDIGMILPKRVRTGSLSRGQMGYVIVGLRDPRQSQPGSVLVRNKDLSRIMSMELPAKTGANAASAQSVLFASVHPMDGDGFDELSAAVDRLSLNDTGLEVHRTAGRSSNSEGGPFLGPGLRVGFQGLLHVEVFRQRLLDEFGLEAIVTPPKVPYTIHYLPSSKYKRSDDAPSEVVIEDLSEWPPHGQRFRVREPMVDARIMAPVDCAGSVMELIKRRRGKDLITKPIDEATWLFTSRMPWGEVVTDFYDELKNSTAGYASFDTFPSDPPLQEANLSKVDILLNAEVVDPLAFVCHKDSAQKAARVVCKKLQDALPRQQFVTVIQAKADGKIIASERIRAYRKDVLAIGGGKTVGGGDISRKKKLLDKQKKGKKRQQTSGKVQLSQEAFNSVISRS